MAAAEPLLWERWSEVDRLLDEVMDLPVAEREPHVRRAVGQDPAFQDLLLRLVRRLGADIDLLPDEHVVRAAFSGGDAVAGGEELPPGTEVGRFRVIGRLGRGGMATVYEAERADGAYEQRVALKVLRRGLDTADMVRRFVTERQILSSLSHRNIARLLDGGSTGDGRPFLVMELVTGEPITRWADHQRLEIAERLRLFLAVADGVHAAHRQLVVHRDIKPSNIMVGTDGQVKLLDFGIAKLLDRDGGQTDVSARALTPEYASPEQLSGGPVTTATDVYQLGLLLRELLTGVRPLATDTAPGEPALRLGRAVHLEVRASPGPAQRALDRGTTPQRLHRLLRGDLDVIVGKALRPAADERYGSADQMAEDVRRHLAGLPIAAHPESAAYRIRKFVTRHRMFLPAVASVILAIGVYVGTLERHTRRVERERDLAETASRRARETQAFFVSLLQSADPFTPADPVRGRSITVLEALELGAERVRRELGGQPELKAALLSTIGAVLLNLDQTEPARAVVDEALALRASMADTGSAALGDDLLALGRMLGDEGLFDSARSVLGRYVRLEKARTPPRTAQLSEALQSLSRVEAWSDLERAVQFSEEAVAVARAEGGIVLAAALRTLADQYRLVDRYEESEMVAREALALHEQIEGPTSANVGLALHTLGQTLGARGRPQEAAALMERSIAIADERLGPEHQYTISMRNNLGVQLISAEAYVEAERVFREVVKARRRMFGAEHPGVAGVLQNVAVTVAGQGRYREALALTDTVEAIYRKAMPAGSHLVALPMLTRAEIQLTEGDAVGAARSAGGAARILRGKVPVTSAAAIMADCRLGRARVLLGEREAGRVLLDSAVRRMASAEGVRDAHRTECETALAALGELGPQARGQATRAREPR